MTRDRRCEGPEKDKNLKSNLVIGNRDRGRADFPPSSSLIAPRPVSEGTTFVTLITEFHEQKDEKPLGHKTNTEILQP